MAKYILYSKLKALSLITGFTLATGSLVARADATHVDFFEFGAESPVVHMTSDLGRISFNRNDNSVEVRYGKEGNIVGSYKASSLARISFSDAPVAGSGLNLLPEKADLRLYPNPAAESFRVKVADTVSLAVTSLCGSTIRFIREYNGEPIDISDLPDGIYLVKAGSLTTKLVKE